MYKLTNKLNFPLIVIIIFGLLFLYKINKYGFMGYAQKKRENRQKRQQMIYQMLQ
jgi:hypothetical protein